MRCGVRGIGRRAARAAATVMCLACVLSATGADAASAGAAGSPSQPAPPILLTQVPAEPAAEASRPSGSGLSLPPAEGARLLLVHPGRGPQVLSRGFHSACDPAVSFDGQRVLFAGKRQADDPWNIFEIDLDHRAVRQVTRESSNCRQPAYQSTLYTIVSAEPWYQLTFVSDLAGTMNETGARPAHHLYSCMLDGSNVQRITFNLSDDADPFLMNDGRVLYASWQRSTLAHGLGGRSRLFAVNIDGTDNALFADATGKRFQRMPCVSGQGLVVFVEGDELAWDGAGQLGSVQFRRPLRTYRSLTSPAEGWFHSPSPWVDGRVLTSWRPASGEGTHGVYLLAPRSGDLQPVYDAPAFHDIQARVVHPVREPDGRSSVVNRDDPHGKLYCLNVYLSDQPGHDRLPRGALPRLRVLEGVPVPVSQRDRFTTDLPSRSAGSSADSIPPLALRRILGEVDIMEDGSFNIEVPANTPVQLQTLDENGMAVRTCHWIWARNREPRGCVGCHEDGERVPENVFVQSVQRDAIPLTLPPARRRTVDFRRDVMPVIERKCVSCHAEGGAPPRLDGGSALLADADGQRRFNRAYLSLLAPDPDSDDGQFVGRYVHPGRARTSPLIWHLFGRNTSRPWDDPWPSRPCKPIPPHDGPALTDDDRATFVEWVDLGAAWNGAAAIQGATGPSGK